MITVNPYLYFNGNCEEAFDFYSSVFNTKYSYIGRYNDVPGENRGLFTDQEDDKIMHISLPISPQTTLMGADSVTPVNNPVSTNNFSLAINAETRAEADRLFQILAVGGEIKLPMNETFWGSYYGIVTDRFGINWKISFESNSDRQTSANGYG